MSFICATHAQKHMRPHTLCLSIHGCIYHLSTSLWAVLKSHLPFCLSICLSIHLPVRPSKLLFCSSTRFSICLSLFSYYIWLSIAFFFDHTTVISVNWDSVNQWTNQITHESILILNIFVIRHYNIFLFFLPVSHP